MRREDGQRGLKVAIEIYGPVLVVRAEGEFAGPHVRTLAATVAGALKKNRGARALVFDLSACEVIDSLAVRFIDALSAATEVACAGARAFVAAQLRLLPEPAHARILPTVGAALEDLARRYAGSASAAPCARACPEQRGAPRLPFVCRASLRLPGARFRVSTLTRDVSPGGVGLDRPRRDFPDGGPADQAQRGRGPLGELRIPGILGRPWVCGRLIPHPQAASMGVDLGHAPATMRARLAAVVLSHSASGQRGPAYS